MIGNLVGDVGVICGLSDVKFDSGKQMQSCIAFTILRLFSHHQKINTMKQWYCSQINYSTKKPWLNSLALAFQNPKPGQSCHKAIITAQLGLAYLGLAWLGSWPQAGPGTALHEMDFISAFCHTLLGTICCPAGNELMVKCWQIRDV